MTSVWASLVVAYYDLKEIFGSPAAAFALLFSTCMTLVIIAMVLSGAGGSFNDRLAYLFPGMLGLQCLTCLSMVGGRIQSDRANGTFVLMLLSPTNSQSLVVGHLCGAVVRVLVQAIALLLVVSLLLKGFVADGGWTIFIAVWALFMGVVVFSSLGVVLRILFPQLSQILLMIMMSGGTISSTAYFTRETIPAKLRSIAEVNPVSFLCDSLRCGLYANDAGVDWRPILILTAMALVALVLALLCARILDRQPEGS